MGRIPTRRNPNPWKEEPSDKKKRQSPHQYDSLRAGDIPYESPYPKTRHPISSPERTNAIEHSVEIINGRPDDYPFPKGKLSDELEKYSDKDLARLVDNIARAHYECARIINQCNRILNDQPLIEKPEQKENRQELFHYYVYIQAPCQQRLGAIYKLMELIVTDQLFRNPQLGSDIQQLGHSVVRKAKEIDERLRPLKALPYWNERNYTGPITEFRTYVKMLLDKLNHIGKLLEKDLTPEKKAETDPQEKDGKRRGQPKNKEAEKSIDSLKELLKNETQFSDIPKGTRKESWEWIADKIGYPKNPQNKTPRYNIMQGYLGRNCPKLYAKLKRIVEKN